MKLFLLALLVASTAEAGTLVVRSQPGVEVTWDGVALGVTGEDGALPIAGIPPGTYAVRLSKAGHRTAERNITVGEGEAALNLTLALIPPPPLPLPPSLILPP